MTDPEQDEEFEAFLKRRTLLPDAMSADDKLGPPSALDDIVLKKAREAVKAQQQPQRGRAPRWAVPVGLAATILLCLSVVMNISLNTNRPTTNIERMAASGNSAPQSPTSIVEPAPRANEASANAPQPSAVASNQSAQPAIVPSDEGGTGASARADAAAPEAARQLGAAGPRAALRANHATTFAKEAANAPALARKSGQSELRESASGDIASGGVDLPEAAVTQSPTVRPRVATSIAPAPQTPGEPMAPAPSAAASSANAPESLAADTQEQVAEPKAREAKAVPHPQDPEVWLRQIEALRAEGKTAQADAEMRRFRAAFPAYPAKPALPAASESPPASSEPPK